MTEILAEERSGHALPPSGFRRIAEALDHESALFIASEFVFSSDVGGTLLGAPRARTKLGRLIQQHYEQFPKEGAGWIGCSRKMKHAIELLRKNLSSSSVEERIEVLRKSVEVSDPDFFDGIEI